MSITRGRSRALTGACSLLLAACAGAESRAPQGVTVRLDTLGAVPHVISAGTPPAWSLEPLVALDAAGEEEFGEITGVVLGGDGAVFVADDLAKQIYHFAPNGTFESVIGREGGGPGEFRALRSLAWIGDYLATLDAGNGRITTLRPDGRAGPHIRWLALTGNIRLEQTAPGEAYALLPIFDEESRASSSQVYLQLTGVGVADTLPSQRYPSNSSDTGIICEGRGMISFFAVPEQSRPFDARAPERLTVLARTGEYRFAFVGPAGDTVHVVQRELPNPPLLDEDWERIQRDWSAFQERTRGMRCNRSSIERPPSKAAFASVFFDDRGRFWVEARDTVGYRFDIFDAAGALVGQLAAPERDRRLPPYVRAGRMAYVVRDSLDVQSVRVARVVE